jgi:hypothetical protein
MRRVNPYLNLRPRLACRQPPPPSRRLRSRLENRSQPRLSQIPVVLQLLKASNDWEKETMGRVQGEARKSTLDKHRQPRLPQTQGTSPNPRVQQSLSKQTLPVKQSLPTVLL